MKRRLHRYQELLNSAADQKKKQQLSALISLVGIPPDLCYWFDGLERTQQILLDGEEEFDQLLEAVHGANPRTVVTADWLDWIELGDRLAKPMIEPEGDPMSLPMGRLKAEDKHPLTHYCLGICPHWAALFYEMSPSATSEQQQAYQALQAKVSRYILAAHARTRDPSFVDRYAEWRGISAEVAGLNADQPVGRIQAASRSLRRLAHADFAGYIEWLDNVDQTLVDLCDAAGKQLKSEPAPTAGERDVRTELGIILGDLRRLGELVLGTAKLRAQESSRARRATRREWPDGYIRITGHRLSLSEEKLDDETRLLRIFEHADHRKLSPSDWDEPGPPPIDPADEIGIAILASSEAWEGPRRLQSERQIALIARQSTAPTLDRSSLTPWQVKRLLDTLPKVEPKLRSYLIASLATGRDLAEDGVQILTTCPRSPPKIAFLADAQPAWIVRIDPPAFAGTNVSKAERRTTSVLKLPDLLGFASCLGQPAPSTVTRSDEIRSSALGWLRHALWDPSLSLAALHGFLARRLLELTGGDLGLHQLLLGSSRQHSGSSAHYTTRSSRDALDLYCQALSLPANGMPATLPNAPEMPNEAPEDTVPSTPPDEQMAGVPAGDDPGVGSASHRSVVIGARRVPSLDSVGKLVKSLAKKIAQSTGAELRNALTAYTLVAFNVGAAGRALETRRLRDFSRAYRLVVLAEKGKAYNERLVPLAPTLDVRLDAYLNALASWGCSPDGPYGLFCWWNECIEPAGSFTPKHFSTLAEALGFDLDLYALRRFARSELIERRASPEDVDALMGHWLHLLSPHDPLSTYPMRRLRALVNDAVETLLRDLEIHTLVWPPPIRRRKPLAHDTVETSSQAQRAEAST
jgi:hypothetical protein